MIISTEVFRVSIDCVADAELIVAQLAENCDYEPHRILLMTSKSKVHLQPTRRNLQVQVEDWLNQAKM